MIILDTNVVSETVRTQPSPTVMRWLQGQSEALALTSITVGELLTGVRPLPPGRRRDGLLAAIEEVLMRQAVILSYDEAAARVYAIMREKSRAVGRPLSVEDGMIAAIAAARGAALATRHVTDFDFLPITTVNPWRADD